MVNFQWHDKANHAVMWDRKDSPKKTSCWLRCYVHSVKKIRRGVPPSSSMQQSIYCTYCRWGFIERTTTAQSYHRRGHLWSNELRENLQSQRPWFMPETLIQTVHLGPTYHPNMVPSLTDQSILRIHHVLLLSLNISQTTGNPMVSIPSNLHFKGQRWQVCLGVSDWWKPTRHITVNDTPAANVTIGHQWTSLT